MRTEDFDILSGAFSDILAADSQVEKLAEGMKFTEGPVWIAREGYLLFSDLPGNRILRWSLREGLSVWREPSGTAIGNTVDRQGRLVTCEASTRRVSRTEADGRVITLADRYMGKRLNSPNDVVVKSDGTVWFTDPAWGIQPHEVEQPKNYVFRLDPKTGEITTVAEDLVFPNGLCFSPDEKTLYIADWWPERHLVQAFQVRGDGTLANGRVFSVIEPGKPDGMRVDTKGRLYCTAGDGIHVFSPSGELLGKIKLPAHPSNLTFGGEGKHTLFITVQGWLNSVKLAATGAQTP